MATSETLDDALIAVADPRTGEHHVLIEGGSMPRYPDDGRWLLFSSDRAGGGYRCYRMPRGGGAAPESLLDGRVFIHSISYPARMLGFSLVSPGDGSDAHVVPIAGDGKPTGKPVLDGRRRRVTSEGGENPLWNRDGSRLFYSSNGRVVSQALRSASEMRFDAPQAVSGSDTPGEIAGFDVAPDGSSALVGRIADPLMLVRDIRLWPGWGATLPSFE